MRTTSLISLCAVVALSGCQQSWQTVPIREPPEDLPFQVEWVDQHGDLAEVFFTDEEHGWAVGNNGVILATRDGGAKWEPQWSGIKAHLLDVHFIDQKIGWVVGTTTEKAGVVLHTNDGGATWARDSRPKIDRVRAVQFVDAQTGWLMELKRAVTHPAFSDEETEFLLRTSDGGKSWSRITTPIFDQIHFADAAHGWATACGSLWARDCGSLWATANGGVTWEPGPAENEDSLHSPFFLNETTGWVINKQTNAVMRTNDGGKNWSGGKKSASRYFDLQFIDERNGWARSDEGLLRTSDGGESWQAWPPPNSTRFDGLYFRSLTHGWAVGGNGAIFATKDGGITWLQQNQVPTLETLGFSPKDVKTSRAYDPNKDPQIIQGELDPRWRISQILFANVNTAWAIGRRSNDSDDVHVGVILSTTDRGITWQSNEFKLFPHSLHYVGAGKVFVFAGELSDEDRPRKGVISGRSVNQAPWVKEFAVREDSPLSVVLRWKAHDEDPATVTTALVEFSQGTDRNFGELKHDGLTREPDGTFSLVFRPSDHGIAAGAAVYYRVILQDAKGLRFTHQIPRAFTYSSWWNRQSTIVQVLVGVAALAACFYILCWGLLYTFPVALLWAHEHVPLEKLTTLVPSNAVKSLVEILTSILGLAWFAKQPRVRDAWLQQFAHEPRAAQRLSNSMQLAFLGSDPGRAIWLEHYQAGRGHMNELPDALRNTYIQKPDFLDVWLKLHAPAVEKAYAELETVRQRQVWIELPIRIGERTTGDYITNPSRSDFHARFAPKRIIVEIIGEGGTGKSTLAIQLGRWALASEPDARLAVHRMIPVLVQEETTDLVGTVRGLLREMVGAGEIEQDLLASLLKHQRILVIVDALSERSETTRKAVCAVHRVADVNALLVTTRRPLDFGAKPVAHIWPEKVTTEKLVYFLTEYLRRTGREKFFPGREALQLGDRLMAVVEGGTSELHLTPLFITLFIDQAVELRARNQSIELLPASIPDIILAHLRGTNPKGDTQNAVDDDTLITAAKVLAARSLAERYVPRDLFHEDAEAALREHGLGREAIGLIERLIANNVIEERSRGGTRILRFVLDPIAEYLAALHWLTRLRGDADAWRTWLDTLRAQPGYPELMRGFLVALDNCVIAFGGDFGTPDFVKFT